MTDPQNAPEPPAPQGPDWSAFEQAGITPDNFSEVQNALNMSRGLQNLDTRGQYLQQIVNPQYDAQILQQFTQPQEQHDPWEQYNQQFGQPQYVDEQGNPIDMNAMYQPQFDPSQLPQVLDPVLAQREQDLERRVFERLQGMAHDQSLKDAASKAASSAGLPPNLAALIENHVRETSKTQLNAQPGQIAEAYAKQLQTELLQWKAEPPAQPAPTTGTVPGGPSPDTLQRPRTFEEALEYSKNVLNQS